MFSICTYFKKSYFVELYLSSQYAIAFAFIYCYLNYYLRDLK